MEWNGKKEENIPKIIKRDLYKLSAILEVVDDRLHEIKNKVEEHFKYIHYSLIKQAYTGEGSHWY